jgi:hypothetical protein
MSGAQRQVLFDLGSDGQRVRVVLHGRYAPNAADLEAGTWLRAAIEIEAQPFGGTIDTVFTPDDVTEWLAELTAFAAGAERCGVGGNRAPS